MTDFSLAGRAIDIVEFAVCALDSHNSAADLITGVGVGFIERDLALLLDIIDFQLKGEVICILEVDLKGIDLLTIDWDPCPIIGLNGIFSALSVFDQIVGLTGRKVGNGEMAVFICAGLAYSAVKEIELIFSVLSTLYIKLEGDSLRRDTGRLSGCDSALRDRNTAIARVRHLDLEGVFFAQLIDQIKLL